MRSTSINMKSPTSSSKRLLMRTRSGEKMSFRENITMEGISDIGSGTTIRAAKGITLLSMSVGTQPPPTPSGWGNACRRRQSGRRRRGAAWSANSIRGGMRSIPAKRTTVTRSVTQPLLANIHRMATACMTWRGTSGSGAKMSTTPASTQRALRATPWQGGGYHLLIMISLTLKQCVSLAAARGATSSAPCASTTAAGTSPRTRATVLVFVAPRPPVFPDRMNYRTRIFRACTELHEVMTRMKKKMNPRK